MVANSAVPGKELRVEIANIGLFENHDARIVAQLPSQLAVANVDGKHARGAVRKQTIGKPAGRRADVQNRFTVYVKGELR